MAILSIPITKAGNRPISVDIDAIPEAIYAEALAEGLKVILNKRMSKVGSITKLDGEEKEKAMALAFSIAQENLAAAMEGKSSKRGSSSSTKLPAAVRTEAMRLARMVVKDEIRNAGMSPSKVENSVITNAAKQLIEQDPSLIETAKANLEAKVRPATSINLADLGVVESPKLVKKAEEAKLARKAGPISAKQAGKVAPRKAQQPTAH